MFRTAVPVTRALLSRGGGQAFRLVAAGPDSRRRASDRGQRRAFQPPASTGGREIHTEGAPRRRVGERQLRAAAVRRMWDVAGEQEPSGRGVLRATLSRLRPRVEGTALSRRRRSRTVATRPVGTTADSQPRRPGPDRDANRRRESTTPLRDPFSDRCRLVCPRRPVRTSRALRRRLFEHRVER